MKSKSSLTLKPVLGPDLLYLLASFVSASHPCPVLPYTNARLLYLGLLVQTTVVSGVGLCSVFVIKTHLELAILLQPPDC